MQEEKISKRHQQFSDNIEKVGLTIERLHRIPMHHKITEDKLKQLLAADGYERVLRGIQRHLKQITEQFDIGGDGRSKPHGSRWRKKPKACRCRGQTNDQHIVNTKLPGHEDMDIGKT